MNNSNAKVKKHKTLYQVLGIIGDIIIIPVILIALISSSAMFVSRSQNALPSIFGLSLVFVASESMVPSGFLKGDVLFLTKTDPYSLKVGTPDDITDELGDVIAFYSYADPADKKISLNKVENDVVLQAPDSNNLTVSGVEDRINVDKLPDNTKIVFHEVVGRYVDDDGTLFLVTKGTGNVNTDIIKVRADYVIGKYSYTPNWLRATFRFCASQIGMIVLVVMPLGILILFQCFSLIEQTNNMMIEKNVIKGRIKYNAPESIKANVGIEMNEVEKVRFYALASEEDKQGVEDFLWKYLENGNKKDVQKYHFVKRTIEAFKVSPDKYFDLWERELKGKKNLQKLSIYREEWRLKDSIKQNDDKTNNLKQGVKIGQETKSVGKFEKPESNKKQDSKNNAQLDGKFKDQQSKNTGTNKPTNLNEQKSNNRPPRKPK